LVRNPITAGSKMVRTFLPAALPSPVSSAGNRYLRLSAGLRKRNVRNAERLAGAVLYRIGLFCARPHRLLPHARMTFPPSKAKHLSADFNLQGSGSVDPW